jgi:DNA-directed RNA polymerase specialized sigma24 family protein
MLRSKTNSAKARVEQRILTALDEVSLIHQAQRPHPVEEIVNDTMLVAWRKANTFDLRSKVSTWIVGIAFAQTPQST